MEDWRIYLILLIFAILAISLFYVVQALGKEFKKTFLLSSYIILILFNKEIYNDLKEMLAASIPDIPAKDEIELGLKINNGLVKMLDEKTRGEQIVLARKVLWELKKNL